MDPLVKETTHLLAVQKPSTVRKENSTTVSTPDTYPKAVFFVLGNEFCERFSYYGLRAVLVLYLTQELLYDEDTATVIFHAFTMACYFTPLFGALLADFLLGKFKTILYLSVIYALGNSILSLASIPDLLPIRPMSMIGLVLIAMGTGGIKPCVSSFGGDQFKSTQKKQLIGFFSLFYFFINFGSLLSMLLTPVLRADVRCFDESTCFPLALGLPALLMILSIIVFISGRSIYRMTPPNGHVNFNIMKCIVHAAVKKCGSLCRGPVKNHWLDYADDRYQMSVISEAKNFLRILTLFLPLPIFWALFDQQGSRWTLQATKLNTTVLGYNIQPDQLQAVNPLLILIFVPVFQYVLYPLTQRCNLLTRPLQRMSIGGLLAALSFVLAGILQMQIENGKLRIVNGLPCQLNLESSQRYSSLSPYQMAEVEEKDNLQIIIDRCQHISFSGMVQQSTSMLKVWEGDLLQMKDDAKKADKGETRIEILSSLENITFYLLDAESYKRIPFSRMNESYLEMHQGEYVIYATYQHLPFSDSNGTIFVMEKESTYDLILTLDQKGKLKWWLNVVPPSNPSSILLQIPQYFLITAGEIMFSITGLSFSYSQASESSKSLIQACWFLTDAFGNLIVLIITQIKIFEKQSNEFFLFAGLMAVDMIIFAIIAYFYKHIDPDEQLHNSKRNQNIAMDNDKKLDKQVNFEN